MLTIKDLSAGHALDREARSEILGGGDVFSTNTQLSAQNANAGLVGLVIERASGQGYARFIRERLLQPLGMRSAGLVDDAATRRRLATGSGEREDVGTVTNTDREKLRERLRSAMPRRPLGGREEDLQRRHQNRQWGVIES